jgi:hypothetical protein
MRLGRAFADGDKGVGRNVVDGPSYRMLQLGTPMSAWAPSRCFDTIWTRCLEDCRPARNYASNDSVAKLFRGSIRLKHLLGAMQVQVTPALTPMIQLGVMVLPRRCFH